LGEPQALWQEDLAWIQRASEQARRARALWSDDGADVHRLCGGEWVAIDDGRVVFHARDDAAVEAWLQKEDPDRVRFLVRFIPEIDAEFAFESPA